MLIKVKQLVVENNGYKRNITFKNIYINSTSIISIADYTGIRDFLLQEDPHLEQSAYSLIRVSQGNRAEDIIAFGTADSIYSELNRRPGSKLLND
jgi:hypothetical protein